MSAVEARAPEHVLRDLLHKCGQDVSAALLRSAMLVDHPLDRAVIAAGGASGAFGAAVGMFCADMASKPSPEEAADALWERLRPSVINAIHDLRKDPSQ